MRRRKPGDPDYGVPYSQLPPEPPVGALPGKGTVIDTIRRKNRQIQDEVDRQMGNSAEDLIKRGYTVEDE